MEDGLYTVRFHTRFGDGAGVVHKVGNRLYGGDSGFAYLGELKEENGRYEARLQVIQHEPGLASVFGPLTNFSLSLSGSASGNSAVFQGITAAAPGEKIDVQLKFLNA